MATKKKMVQKVQHPIERILVPVGSIVTRITMDCVFSDGVEYHIETSGSQAGQDLLWIFTLNDQTVKVLVKLDVPDGAEHLCVYDYSIFNSIFGGSEKYLTTCEGLFESKRMALYYLGQPYADRVEAV